LLGWLPLELLPIADAVMLSADAYADLIDRHVELASDLAGLGSLLDFFEPTEEDAVRRRRGRSNAAVPVGAPAFALDPVNASRPRERPFLLLDSGH
jgi:hypothetical protein